MSTLLHSHGWPIAIWGTVEKSGKNDFNGKVSYWAVIARSFQKNDGSAGSQRIFVTGGERSGLDAAQQGLGIICSAVYQEGKDKQGGWKPKPWVTSSTVFSAGVPIPGNPSSYPPASTAQQPYYPYQNYQQHTPAQIPPPHQTQQTGIYHEDFPF